MLEEGYSPNWIVTYIFLLSHSSNGSVLFLRDYTRPELPSGPESHGNNVGDMGGIAGLGETWYMCINAVVLVSWVNELFTEVGISDE